MGPDQAVRTSPDNDQLASFDSLMRAFSGCTEGTYPIGVTVYDQGWNSDHGEVFPEIGEPCRDAVICPLK